MQTRLTLTLAIVALLAAPALAQVPPEEPIQGEIVSLTDDSLTLELHTGQHATYAIEEDTVMPADLSKGDTVAVQNLPGTGDDGLESAREIVLVANLDSNDGIHDNGDSMEMEAEVETTAEAEMTAETETTTEVKTTAEVETQTPETRETDSQVAQTPPAENNREADTSEDESDEYLPQTATPLAALTVLGLLSLGGAVLLRRLYA